MNNLRIEVVIQSILKSTGIALFLFFALFVKSNAQVAINETDAAPNAGAELDISSTTKGVLFPVMTQVQRDAIPGPAAGLIIFNITGGYHNYYNGTNWVRINRTLALLATNPVGAGTDVGVGVGVADPDNSAILHVNSTSKGFLLPRISGVPSSPSAGMIYYNTGSNQVFFYNTAWDQLNLTVSSAGAGGVSTAAGVLIGPGTIAPSAKMEVKTSTTKGLLIPRMTTAQRDLIVSPAEGLTLYNSTVGLIQFFLGNTWYNWSSASNNYGQVIGNPGLSCNDIYNNNPGSNGVDGTYYIIPNGSTYACTCDMTTNSGGWTLVENTGPRISNSSGTGAVGVMPISTSNALGTFTKLSDVDINLIRGGAPAYATSVFMINRQNSTVATKVMYFAQNTVFNSAAAGNTAIKTYYATYAGASTQTGGSSQGYYSGGANGAFDCWNCPDPFKVMSNYAAEGWITNSNTFPTNRSESNVLIWVK